MGGGQRILILCKGFSLANILFGVNCTLLLSGENHVLHSAGMYFLAEIDCICKIK
jgi:hypothetical protein